MNFSHPVYRRHAEMMLDDKRRLRQLIGMAVVASVITIIILLLSCVLSGPPVVIWGLRGFLGSLLCCLWVLWGRCVWLAAQLRTLTDVYGELH